jgi:hypothetical protein
MSFDPEIATRTWEVYKDPSEESIEAPVPQPEIMRAVRVAPRLATTAAGSHPASVSAPVTNPQDHREPAPAPPSSSRSSTPPNHVINYAPNEAARIQADRMLRSMNMIFKEERKRQRRIVDAAIANFGADVDVDMELRPANSREMIARMERRYAELTLAEEGERDRRRGQESGGEGEAGQEEREMERQEQAHAPVLGPPHPIMQSETHQPQHTRPGERIYGPDIRVPVTANSTSTFISMSGTAPTGMGPGLSFAERARARARDMEEDNARKRAKLMGPDLGAGDGDGDGDRDGDGDEDARFGVSGGGFAGVGEVMSETTDLRGIGLGPGARARDGVAADVAMYDVPDQRGERYSYDNEDGDDQDHDHDHDLTDGEKRKRKRDRERERKGKRKATGMEGVDEDVGQA